MVEIYFVERKRDSNGNPVYKILIPGLNRKIKGLRKLKGSGLYSIQSYSLESDLKQFLKPKSVKLKGF